MVVVEKHSFHDSVNFDSVDKEKAVLNICIITYIYTHTHTDRISFPIKSADTGDFIISMSGFLIFLLFKIIWPI